ncbi:MAG: hypothetical protein JWO68_1790, partial [Actinomycetia bacterium]|nr:hypothetical protein [Actinomycetes bacterium]
MTSDSPEERLTDVVPAGAALALHHALGSPGAPPVAGDALAPLGHWLAFLPRVPQGDLRDDGHPVTGLLPSGAAGKRRMFVGARLRYEGSLAVDEPLSRQGHITSVTTKSGSAGELVFATLRYEVEGAGGRIEEEQDHVYLVDQPAPRPVADGDPTPDGWPWAGEVPVDPRLLFRFSALTYNAHRIHYDRAYARDVEGYPALVVHGPLQAMAQVDLARRWAPERTTAELTFRTLR